MVRCIDGLLYRKPRFNEFAEKQPKRSFYRGIVKLATTFLHTLNSAHTSVKFTMEVEKNSKLPFLGTELLNHAPRIETKVRGIQRNGTGKRKRNLLFFLPEKTSGFCKWEKNMLRNIITIILIIIVITVISFFISYYKCIKYRCIGETKRI